MENNEMGAAAMAAQNAAMQQVVNTKSQLEIATSSSYSDQHKAFGTHFGKNRTEVEVLLERVKEQLANLPKWEANLKALEKELNQKKADESFEELKALYAFLSEEQKKALAAG